MGDTFEQWEMMRMKEEEGHVQIIQEKKRKEREREKLEMTQEENCCWSGIERGGIKNSKRMRTMDEKPRKALLS